MINLKENNFSLECDFATLLPYINSAAEQTRARRLNRNIKASTYPITKELLQNHYLNTNFSNLKSSFKNVNCAAEVYSYFVQSFGYSAGSPGGSQYASGANSSGLNPFFGVGADLGFNFGAIGSYLWLLLILGAGVYVYNKTSK